MASTKKRFWRRAVTAAAATSLVLGGSVVAAQAYDAAPGTVYQLGADPCLKGRGNCVIYAKSTQLPGGRLLAAFERSVVPASGSADGQTIPVMKSDDFGATWQPLAQVQAPAYASDDPAVDKYISNWTNPYLYVLPETVGDLQAGTILLATVVSGEDEYYVQRKAADPNWVPTSDGDRRDLALALYASTDEGQSWSFQNIIAQGGWQGGSAGNIGVAISAANVHAQIDPVWEPHLEVHDGKLVAYYSDENDYLGYDPVTGIPTIDPANDTATDSRNQILVHKTWDGGSTPWSEPVVDVAGGTKNMGGGKTVIGGGRPGMTTIGKTTDGKYLLTFEYFGGGANVRYKVSDDPLNFFADGDGDGNEITALPVEPGSRALARGGSPVTVTLPDGRIAYNSAGSGNVWINQSGRSDGAWTEYQTTLGTGYSRSIQYVEGTGRILLFQGVWGGGASGSIIRHAEVDFGSSEGAYYQLVNRKTGQVIGTGGKSNDANLGNANTPDIRSEAPSATAATQLWHVTTKPNGKATLLNKSGGRAAAIWTGTPSVGQRLGQWVDQGSNGLWNIVDAGDGHVRLQSATNSALYVTGASAGSAITLQNAATDGSQDWLLVPEQPSAAALSPERRAEGLISDDPVGAGATITLNAAAFTPAGAPRNADRTGTVWTVVEGNATKVGAVVFDQEQRGSVTLPSSLAAGTAFQLAVVFDESPLLWDAATVVAPPTPDTERPTATLASPTTAGPFSSLSVSVDATDDRGLKRIVANIYKDGTLVKSTQTPVAGATTGSHAATVTLPSGNYTVKYNAQDLAGNISKTGVFAFTIDATAPTVTVKDGSSFTVGSGGVYDLVSFKLHDAGKIDKVAINGTVKDLTDNAWSDVNFVKPGTFGAVQGENSLVVYDVAGNTTTLTFALN